MGFEEDSYPGGRGKFQEDHTSTDSARHQQAADHLQNARTLKALGESQDRNQSKLGSPKPIVTPITPPSPGIDRTVNELFRWRTLAVLAALFLIFLYTPLWALASASPHEVLWRFGLLAVLLIALMICSPTAGRTILVFLIGAAILFAALVVGVNIYMRVIHPH
jgi:hypothetical protein